MKGKLKQFEVECCKNVDLETLVEKISTELEDKSKIVNKLESIIETTLNDDDRYKKSSDQKMSLIVDYCKKIKSDINFSEVVLTIF